MTEVQKVILSIFKEIDKICQDHQIPYYAIGGTCIGAVRHNGFIPWDDDLDIAIPIEHFEKFIDVARNELPSYLYIQTPDDLTHYHYIWSKVCDKRTTFIEKSEYKYKDAYKGVFVDVMPISGIPEEGKKREVLYRKIKRLAVFNSLLRFRTIPRSIKGFIAQLLFSFLSCFLPYNYFSKKYLSLLKKYPFGSSSYTGYVWHYEWLRRLTFPTSFFGNGTKLKFEDTFIICPTFFDRYLKQQFGDYMTPPPIEQQEVHDGIVDLNTSFELYKEKGIV